MAKHIASSVDEPLEALRRALVAGEESGDPEPFDFAAFVAAKKS